MWPDFHFSDEPLVRIGVLFVSFMLSSMAYNLIKGEEINEKTKRIPKKEEFQN